LPPDELVDMWRNCREDSDTLINRTRVLVLPSAKIWTPSGRNTSSTLRCKGAETLYSGSHGSDVAVYVSAPDGHAIVRSIDRIKKPPEGGSFYRKRSLSSSVQRHAIPAPISQEAKPRETQDHHCPGRRLWNS